MVIVQCAVLMIFLALGELIVHFTKIPIPSSIIGMLCLTLALQLKIVKLRHISGVADFLVKNLGFFFVPAGVALMCHLELIRQQWAPIVIAAAGSTIIVLAVTGQVHQLARKLFSSHGLSGK